MNNQMNKYRIELRLKHMELKNELQEIANKSISFEPTDVLPTISKAMIKEGLKRYKGPPIGMPLDGLIDTGSHLLSIIVYNPITLGILGSALYDQIFKPFLDCRKKLNKDIGVTNEIILSENNRKNIRLIVKDDLSREEFITSFDKVNPIIDTLSDLLEQVGIKNYGEIELYYLNNNWELNITKQVESKKKFIWFKLRS